MSFSLEARVWYQGVVAGDEGKGDVVLVGALQGIRWMYMGWKRCGDYPWVCHAWCLDQDDLLKKLDTTYAHTWGGCVHATQDVGFDAGHELPLLRIAGVGDTGTCKYKNGFA